MSQTILNAKIIDQSLELYNLPLIASGGVEEILIHCEFCEMWDGYGKTAVFYRKGGPVYHAVVNDPYVTVPWEVMTDPGVVFFGIMGVGENTRTTEVVRLTVKQGAITTATAEHQDPTPDIYQQLLAAYGDMEGNHQQLQARIDNMVAARPGGGEYRYEVTDGTVSCTIITNGAVAEITYTTVNYDKVLAAGERYEFGEIPAEFCPLYPVELSSSDSDLVVSLNVRGAWNGQGEAVTVPVLEIYNSAQGSSATRLIDQHGQGTFALRQIQIPELQDVRVGADGITYGSAGAAVREQVSVASGATSSKSNPPAAFLPSLPVCEVIDNFQPGTKFKALTLGTFTATAEADTEDYLIGNQSLHFTNCIQATGFNLDLTGKHLRVRFKVNSIDAGANLLLYIADSTAFSQMATFTLFSSSEISNVNRTVKIGEWTDLIIPLASTESESIPSTVGVLRFRFLNGNGDANIQSVMLQDVEEKESKGIVSFTFDDGLVTQYTEAARILGARGIPATAYIIPEVVGNVGSLNEEQLQSLKVDYGWDIESHWGSVMADMSEEELATAFSTVKKWIQDRGLGRGDHFAYPGGAHNATVKKVAQRYFTTARSIDYKTLRGIKSTLITDPYSLNAISAVGNNPGGFSVNSVKSVIDKVAQSGGWAILVFHSIGDTATSMYCKASDLATIADYAVASGVDIKTIADVLR